MGRKNRIKQSRKKNSRNPPVSETMAPSTSYRKEVKIDGKKDANRSSEEIQMVENVSRIVTEKTEDKESINRYTEDFKAEEQTSSIKEFDTLVKEIKEMLDIFDESVRTIVENLFRTQCQQGSNSPSERLQDFDNYLKCEYPDIFEDMVKCISMIENRLCFKNYPFVKSSLDQMSRIEAIEALTAIEDDVNETNEAMTLEVVKDKDDYNEKTTDLGGEDKNKVGINNYDGIERHLPSILKSTTEKELEKDGNGISGSTQETENYPHNTEFDEEALMKTIETFAEILEKAKYCSKMTHTNEMLHISPRNEKYKKIPLQKIQIQHVLKKELKSLYSKDKTAREVLSKSKSTLKTLKRMKSLYFFNKALEEMNPEVFKENVDQKVDINTESKNVNGYKKKKQICSSTDCIEVSNQNAFEGKKTGKITEEFDRPYVDVQGNNYNEEIINLDQETEYCERKDNTKESVNPEKANKLGKQAIKTGKFEKQENYTDMNLEQILTEYIRNFSEKEPLTAVSKTESHETTRDTTNNTDGRNDEAGTAEESIIDLDKKDSIHFEFENNDNKHIFAGNWNDYYPLNENQGISFNYKDEKVHVCFTGNQVFISTEDSEFNIFIRKSDPAYLTDKSTQTNYSTVTFNKV